MNSDLERELGEQLHRQAAGLHDSPLGLDDVKGRARTIRRNRRLAAGAGVAAALMVAVPTAITAGGMLESSRETPQPVAPSGDVVRTTLTLDGLPRGGAPTVEYFTPDGVVLPGEGTRPLPRSYNALVPSEADGGWIAWEGASLGVRYLTEDFRPQGGSATNDSFVSNPDRTVVAWVNPESGAQTLTLRSTVDPDGTLVWDFPDVSSGVVDPVDFVADDSVVVTTLDPRTGRVEIAVAESDGSTTPLRGYVDALSANPETGLVAVQTRSRKDGSGCFGVVDPAVPEAPVWETCDHALGAFSPDGRYVLASGSYQSGAGIAEVAVLDATTGDEVASFAPERGSQFLLQRLVWESSDSFLAVAAEGSDITMLRFGVDGSLEEVTDRVQGDAFGDLPFFLGGDRVRGF